MLLCNKGLQNKSRSIQTDSRAKAAICYVSYSGTILSDVVPASVIDTVRLTI